MAEREPQLAARVIDRLQEHARATPTRIAFTFLREDGFEESLSFSELDARAEGLAGALAALAAPGERVALLYPPGLDFILAFFACLRAGLVAVPAPLPRRHGAAELRALLADAGPALVLSTGDAAPAVEAALGEGGVRVLASDMLAPLARRSRARQGQGGALAFIQYTSGSTSAPRGVEVTDAALAANVEAIGAAFGFHADSVMLSWLPPFHDMGLVGSIVAPAALGFRSVLMAPNSFLRQPQRWLEAISARGATVAGAPDFAWDLCARRTSEACKAGLDLSRLEVAYNGAEPVRAATLRRLLTAFAGCGLRPQALFPCYGLAEHTLLACGGPRGRAPRILTVSKTRLEGGQVRATTADDPDARELVSCGPPARGVAVLAVDPASFRPAGPGRVGEIWLAGASVARGYRGAGGEAQSSFGARLGDGSGPWLRSGDLGFLDGGELFVTGRLKDLVIVNGRCIYPQDVESVVEEVAGFLEPNRCAAFALEEHASGRERLAIVLEADRHLLRAARRSGGESASFEAIGQRIRTAVARRFGIVVDLLAFVRPGGVPRTTSGKVRRGRCKLLAARGELKVVYAARELHPRRRNGDLADPQASREAADAMLAWLRAYAPRRLDSRLMDERRMIPPHLLLDLGNRGFLGLQAPAALKGKGLATVDLLRIMEQLAALDLTLATTVGVHNGLGLRPVLRYAAPALRERIAPQLALGRQLAAFALTEPAAGANPLAMRTRALRCAGGWRLSGSKHLIGLAGWAGWITVLARALDADGAPLGTVALLVPEDAPGLRLEAEALTMGMRAMVQNALRLDEVFVPDEQVLGTPGAGMEVARDAMAFARLGIGALALGAMKRCAQLMLRYAARREVAGGSLLANPATLARLGALSCAIEALAALVQAIARRHDGAELPQEACMACKCLASELIWEAVDGLVQLLGGRGYLETNLAPQLLRDARVLRILEGPTEALYAHLGAAAETCLAYVEQVLEGGELAAQARSAVRAAPLEAAHGAGELCAWTMLAACAPEGAAAAWALGRRERVLEALRRCGAPLASPEELTRRIRAYSGAIGELEQLAPGQAQGCDPLLALDWAPVPAPRRAGGGDALRALVRECLLNGLRDAGVDAIGDDTSFAEAGLDSLAATPVALELEQRTGLAVGAELLYEFPTVALLAAHLEARMRTRPLDAGAEGDGVK